MFFRIAKQILLSIKDVNDMRIIFFNNFNLGRWISSFRKFKESKIQTIKLTITEDKIIPSTPKLYEKDSQNYKLGHQLKTNQKKYLILSLQMMT